MAATVYIYYQLENYYQNHRRYVKSRSYEQLSGTWLSADDLEDDCDPVVTNADMDQNVSVTGETLEPDVAAFPCGLIAKSFFNDTWNLTSPDGSAISINKTEIA